MTPTEVLRIVFERFQNGDRDGAVALFHEDAAFIYSGPGSLHGTRVGHDAIQRFWTTQDRLSGGCAPELIDLGESDSTRSCSFASARRPAHLSCAWSCTRSMTDSS